MSEHWTTEDIGDLREHTAVITGVTGGLGAATALGLARRGARIVTVSSLAHASARQLDLRVLTAGNYPRRYRRWQAYGESKLANLLFALELNRRATTASLPVTSVAAHPGYASTNLTKTGLTLHGSSLPAIAIHQITGFIGQSASLGALPLLRAATDPDLRGGEYLGPDGFQQLRGKHPRHVGMTRLARDEALAASVWEASEAAAGVRFDVS